MSEVTPFPFDDSDTPGGPGRIWGSAAISALEIAKTLQLNIIYDKDGSWSLSPDDWRRVAKHPIYIYQNDGNPVLGADNKSALNDVFEARLQKGSQYVYRQAYDKIGMSLSAGADGRIEIAAALPPLEALPSFKPEPTPKFKPLPPLQAIRFLKPEPVSENPTESALGLDALQGEISIPEITIGSASASEELTASASKESKKLRRPKKSESMEFSFEIRSSQPLLFSLAHPVCFSVVHPKSPALPEPEPLSRGARISHHLGEIRDELTSPIRDWAQWESFKNLADSFIETSISLVFRTRKNETPPEDKPQAADPDFLDRAPESSGTIAAGVLETDAPQTPFVTEPREKRFVHEERRELLEPRVLPQPAETTALTVAGPSQAQFDFTKGTPKTAPASPERLNEVATEAIRVDPASGVRPPSAPRPEVIVEKPVHAPEKSAEKSEATDSTGFGSIPENDPLRRRARENRALDRIIKEKARAGMNFSSNVPETPPPIGRLKAFVEACGIVAERLHLRRPHAPKKDSSPGGPSPR